MHHFVFVPAAIMCKRRLLACCGSGMSKMIQRMIVWLENNLTQSFLQVRIVCGEGPETQKHQTYDIWFYFEAGLCHAIPLWNRNTTRKWHPTSSEWRWRIWDAKSCVSCYCLCSVLGKYFMTASFYVLWVTSFISLWATHQHNCVCMCVSVLRAALFC